MSFDFATTLIGLVLLGIVLALWLEIKKHRRAEFIRTFKLPPGLLGKVANHHPHIAAKDLDLVNRSLRQFFLAHLLSGRKFVAMPSQVADDLWHEFILYTRDYGKFCDRAFGQFLHHTPAVVMSPQKRESNTGLRRAWYWACKEDTINPRKANRLPLLFAIDAKLGIANGFHYKLDCSRDRAGQTNDGSPAGYCGGDLTSTSYDGTTDGFGNGDGGDGGGDGGCGGGD